MIGSLAQAWRTLLLTAVAVALVGVLCGTVGASTTPDSARFHRYDGLAALVRVSEAVGTSFVASSGNTSSLGSRPLLDRFARFGVAAEEAATLALPRGGATLGQEALEHIVFRHWSTSGAANAGKFASGTTARSLRDMIDTTVRQGALRPNTAGRPGTIFEHDFGGQIGTNIAGNATSRLRVVVRPNGNVITAFPY